MTAVSHPSASVAHRLFNYLEERNVTYVVVGDTRHYDTSIESDVDIIVGSVRLEDTAKLVRDFSRTIGGKLVQAINHEQTAWYYVVSYSHEGTTHYIHPDISTDYYRNGRRLLSANELLANSRHSPIGFRVPAPANAFVYYLIKKIHKGQLDSHQFEYLRSEWIQDPEGASRQVDRFWSSAEAALITKALDANDFDLISASLPRLHTTLNRRQVFSWFDTWNEAVRKLRRLANPTGVFVMFLGADGSGKSSVIERVERHLLPAFRRTQRYHLRPHFGHEVVRANLMTQPHQQPPRNFATSVVKLGLWFVDYAWSYATGIFWQLVKSTLVLFDRYADDIVVDPRRYRYGGPEALARLITQIVPRPHLVILLNAPAEVLQHRKQEVPYPESVRQAQAYLDLVSNMPNGHIVDASKPLECVAIEVEDIVLDYLADRTAHRLGLRS